MTRRLSTIALALLLAAAAPVFATPGHEMAGGHASMQEDLGITAEQATQVRTILKQQWQKRRTLKESTQDSAQLSQQLDALNAETRQRLSTILNAEQVARVEQHMEHRHGGPDHRGDPAAHISRALDLSEEQQSQVKSIFDEVRDEHRKLRSADLQPEERRQRADALHAQIRDKMSRVLNAEQLARFDEMHERHNKRKEGHRHRHGPGDKPQPATSEAPAR
jgi:Spy/CpxP family protein refolding chaperone